MLLKQIYDSMKKLYVLLFMLISTLGYSYSQITLNLSGNFSNNGSPVANEVISILYYDGDSLTSQFIVDTAYTDLNGNFAKSRTLSSNYLNGYVNLITTDCNGSYQTKTFFISPANVNLLVNFSCLAPTCYNTFKFNVDSNTSNGFVTQFFASTDYGQGSTYTWDFGDGTTGTGLYPSHTYAQQGSYTVCLTTFDSLRNCTSVICDSIQIRTPGQECYVSFGFTRQANKTIDFFSYSNAFQSSFITWDFGDGTTGQGYNLSHTYAQDGMYNVCVTVIDTVKYCYTTYCGLVYIGSDPGINCTAQFTATMLPDSMNTGMAIVYFAAYNPNGAYTLFWDFGDGNTATGNFLVHQFTSNGVYNVCAIAVDSATRCMDTVCKQILIEGLSMRIVGIEEESLELKGLYPNPVNTELNLNINVQNSELLKINVRDLTGRVLISNDEKLNAGLNDIKVDVSQLVRGIYIIDISNKDGVKALKFVKE